ncbi:DUF805 domain-containing protein [Enterococcus gilvus]|uniref:DUF805 domain-containing protein n=1 Tax=Enterococcus gilvus TaxID=160453 RepID=UPI001C8C7796|nr:DUF805 domain-containing protein [Enterococcus gilvus]MBX8935575.1 DUF805 domain-containing protein [Enterococcus gilvus]
MISEQPGKVTFIEAHKDFFKGFLDFKGRTTRSGYWWTVPLQFILGIFVGISLVTGRLATAIILLVLIAIPLYAALARRFRDAGLTNKGIIVFLLLPLILSWVLPNASSTTINIVTFVIAAQPTDSLLTKSSSKFILFFSRPRYTKDLNLFSNQ